MIFMLLHQQRKTCGQHSCKYCAPPDHDLPSQQRRKNQHQYKHQRRLHKRQHIRHSRLFRCIKISRGNPADRHKRDRNKKDRHNLRNLLVYFPGRSKHISNTPPDSKHDHTACQRQQHGKPVGVSPHLFHLFPVSFSIITAEQWLASVTDSL